MPLDKDKGSHLSCVVGSQVVLCRKITASLSILSYVVHTWSIFTRSISLIKWAYSWPRRGCGSGKSDESYIAATRTRWIYVRHHRSHNVQDRDVRMAHWLTDIFVCTWRRMCCTGDLACDNWSKSVKYQKRRSTGLWYMSRTSSSI